MRVGLLIFIVLGYGSMLSSKTIGSPSIIKPSDERIVYKLSKPAIMKFRSPRTPLPSPTLLTSLTKLLPFRQSR